MRKIILLFIVCCITIVGRAAEAPKYFAVWLKNGQRIDLMLSEKPNVSFTSGTLKFTATSSSVEYNANDVKEFTLEATQSTGIQDANDGGKECRVSQSGDVLSISGADPYAKISIYSAGGMLISTHSADGNGVLNVSLNQLGPGVYVLNIASTTLKIIRR